MQRVANIPIDHPNFYQVLDKHKADFAQYVREQISMLKSYRDVKDYKQADAIRSILEKEGVDIMINKTDIDWAI